MCKGPEAAVDVPAQVTGTYDVGVTRQVTFILFLRGFLPQKNHAKMLTVLHSVVSRNAK